MDHIEDPRAVAVLSAVRSLFAYLAETGSFVYVERAAAENYSDSGIADEVALATVSIRKVWAEELLRMRELHGPERAIQFAAERLNDPPGCMQVGFADSWKYGYNIGLLDR